jgi:DNA polymerase-2
MRARGFTVVYGDTDSVFVEAGAASTAEAAALGRRLCGEVGADVADRLAATFGCTSRLELEFEKVYERFFMPAVRGRTGGSKKRYAGTVDGVLDVVGLEAVRRDWSGVARRFQRELLGRVFRDEPLDLFIRDFVASLEAGDFDAELEYRRALRKPVGDYTATTPPHVKAARKRTRSDDRIVRYVMTTAGPEPSDERTAPPDYEHYVAHQLEPIADAILPFVGTTDFADATGRRAQLSLF